MPGHGGRTVGITISYERVIDAVKKTRKEHRVKYARRDVAHDPDEKAFYQEAIKKFLRDHKKLGATLQNIDTTKDKNVRSETGWIFM